MADNPPYIATNLPEDIANLLADEWQKAGLSVRKIKESDGEWTVVGTPPATPQAPATEKKVAVAVEKADAAVTATASSPDTAPAWYKIAQQELGQAEIAGADSNRRILEYHASVSSHITSDDVAWCSSFVNFCIEQAGLDGTNSARARSWLKWGKEIQAPQPGCIVVLSRGAPPKGHVGFFVEANDSFVSLLGGNQSNAVNILKFPKSRVLSYRMPG